MQRQSRRLGCILFLAALAPSRRSEAQVPLGPERRDIENVAGDIWSVWTFPRRIHSSDVAIAGATLGTAALTSRIDSVTYAWMQTHDSTFVMQLLAPIRKNARVPVYELGSGQFLLPLSGLLYAAGRLGNSAELRDAGIGCAAGHLSSVGLRQATFHLIERDRPEMTPQPFAFGFPGSSDWMRQSFYSGHISNSMACASFLAHRYALGLAKPLPYAYSLAIGLGRLADGEHWASDMLIGGVVGFAVGKAIADRQLRRRDDLLQTPATAAERDGWHVNVLQWNVVF